MRRLLGRVEKQRRQRVHRSWIFDLYGGLKVTGRSYLPEHWQNKPRHPRRMRKRALFSCDGYSHRTRRAVHYVLPHINGLTFQRPTQLEVQRAHNARRIRYARTATYSDTIRVIYPALLRYFLPKTTTVNTVSTTYWAMRASAPTEQMRDATYHRLRHFRYNQESKQQNNRRTEMLHCLQPRRIWTKPSSY